MFNNMRRQGRDSILAGASLATLETRNSAEAAMRALAAMVPGWRHDRRPPIRLIDLERRAQFARLPLRESQGSAR